MKTRTRSSLVIAAAIALIAATLPFAIGSTSAAWSDRVNAKGTVSAGTWSPPSAPALACAPASASVTATCTVTPTAWTNWGSGYRVDFSVTTTSTTAFEWVVTMNLAATGQAAPGGGTLFPGVPVPSPGSWQPAWTPANFSVSNLCSASTNAALPIVKLKGSEAWDRTVSASAPVPNVGFQANATGAANIATFAC